MPNSTQWTDFIDQRFNEYYLGAALEQLANGGLDEWKEALDELERCKHQASTNPYDAGKHLCNAYKLAYGLDQGEWLRKLRYHLGFVGYYKSDLFIHANEGTEQFKLGYYKEGWYSIGQAFRLYYAANLETDAYKHFGRQEELDNELMRISGLGVGVFTYE